jgi:hypothetical protein
MDAKSSLIQPTNNNIPMAIPVHTQILLDNNEYKKCDTRWNSFYFIIVIPIILLIVVFMANLVIFPIFTMVNLQTLLMLIPLYGLAIIYFNYSLFANRVNSIKEKCFNYGKDIIIKKSL